MVYITYSGDTWNFVMLLQKYHPLPSTIIFSGLKFIHISCVSSLSIDDHVINARTLRSTENNDLYRDTLCQKINMEDTPNIMISQHFSSLWEDIASCYCLKLLYKVNKKNEFKKMLNQCCVKWRKVFMLTNLTLLLPCQNIKEFCLNISNVK